MKPGFAVLEYKVQRATFQIAMFNLHYNSKIRNKGSHMRF